MSNLESFARKCLADFDESHDYNHSIRVLGNAKNIIKVGAYELNEWEMKLLTYSCILHDIIDKKYNCEVDLGTVMIFVETDSNDTTLGALCGEIITNISWSNRAHNKRFVDPKIELIREIVQCADWLDAIGHMGVVRCISYSLLKKKCPSVQIIYEVKKHIDDKLSLIKDNLPLEAARQIALGPHEEIMQWYREH